MEIVISGGEARPESKQNKDAGEQKIRTTNR
jgi:hypothetical protein